MTNILKKEDFASNLPIFQGTFTNLAFLIFGNLLFPNRYFDTYLSGLHT